MKNFYITLGIVAGLFLGVSASVQAATIAFPTGGGTGTSTAPTYGQMLVGNAGRTYTLTATSSLGILSTLLGANNTFTGGNNFSVGTTTMVNGHITGNLQVDGAFFAPVTLVSSGNATINGALTVTGQTTLANASTTQIGSTGSAYFATASGNVGIGTTSPAYKLDVYGQGYFESGLILNSDMVLKSGSTFEFDNATNESAMAMYNIGGVGENKFLIDVAADQNDFVIDNSGNVGIGTTAPFVPLVVNGNVQFGYSSSAADQGAKLVVQGESTGAAMYIQGNAARSASTDLIYSVNRYGIAGGFQMFGDHSMLIGSTGKEFKYVGSTGNVGIGTTSPSRLLSVSDDGTYSAYFSGRVGIGTNAPGYPLEVNGYMKTSSGIILGATSDANNSIAPEGSENQNIILQSYGTGVAGPVVHIRSKNQGVVSNGLVFSTVNNVGSGAIPIASVSTSYSGLTGTNVTGQLIFGTNNNSTAVTEWMRITNSGNVGIGTTSPATLAQLFSTGTSTLSIDSNSATKGSCLEMKDIDGGGYSYITTLNGVMTVSQTSCK